MKTQIFDRMRKSLMARYISHNNYIPMRMVITGHIAPDPT